MAKKKRGLLEPSEDKIILDLSEQELKEIEAVLWDIAASNRKCYQFANSNTDANGKMKESEAIYKAFHSGREDLVKLAKDVLAGSLYGDDGRISVKYKEKQGSKYIQSLVDVWGDIAEDEYESIFPLIVLDMVENKYVYNEKNMSLHTYISRYCILKTISKCTEVITGNKDHANNTMKRVSEATDWLRKHGVNNPTSGDISAIIVYLGKQKRKGSDFKVYNIDKTQKEFKTVKNVSSLVPDKDDEYDHYEIYDVFGVSNESAEDIVFKEYEEEMHRAIVKHLSALFPKYVINKMMPYLKEYMLSYIIASENKIMESVIRNNQKHYSKQDNRIANQKGNRGYASVEQTKAVYEEQTGRKVKMEEFKTNLRYAKGEFDHLYKLFVEQETKRYKEKDNENVKISNWWITDESDEIREEGMDIQFLYDTGLLPTDYRRSEDFIEDDRVEKIDDEE